MKVTRKKCISCKASLACMSGIVDLIYRCNDCGRLVVQLHIYRKTRVAKMTNGEMPGEFYIGSPNRRHACPKYPRSRKVQNQFMMCGRCAGVMP